jgi:hypothetical protein
MDMLEVTIFFRAVFAGVDGAFVFSTDRSLLVWWSI